MFVCICKNSLQIWLELCWIYSLISVSRKNWILTILSIRTHDHDIALLPFLSSAFHSFQHTDFECVVLGLDSFLLLGWGNHWKCSLNIFGFQLFISIIYTFDIYTDIAFTTLLNSLIRSFCIFLGIFCIYHHLIF